MSLTYPLYFLNYFVIISILRATRYGKKGERVIGGFTTKSYFSNYYVEIFPNEVIGRKLRVWGGLFLFLLRKN